MVQILELIFDKHVSMILQQGIHDDIETKYRNV